MKIHFDSYTAFFYLFNEIFCLQVYPPYRDVEVYIDAGANIGMSILWYKMINPSVKILAFEPETTSYKLLLQNLKENKISNVITYKSALSDYEGESKYYLLDDPIQILDSGLKLNQDLPHHISIVETTRLSKYVRDEISLLKLDIEGSEYNVVKDLISKRKFKYIRRCVIEAHYFNEEEFNSFRKLVANLQKFGEVALNENSTRSTLIVYKKT